MLQRLSEDLEYHELLDKAAKCHSSLEQMCYVAAFCVSAYSTTVYRTGKPFNPLLGETYELDRRRESGYRSLCEQVSHHPPAAAHHAISDRGWTLRQEITVASKFRGKYLSIMPLGTIHAIFEKSNNHYTWKKVTTTVHNIIVGKLWIDQSGEIDIVNHTTGDRCHLKFAPYSYFSRDVARKVTGVVMDKDGKAHYVLSGTWDEKMEFSRVMQSSRGGENGTEGKQKTVYQTLKARELWKRNPLPDGAGSMYYFTALALTLNEAEDGVAPTDSRRRPDQRLMEDGRWDEGWRRSSAAPGVSGSGKRRAIVPRASRRKATFLHSQLTSAPRTKMQVVEPVRLPRLSRVAICGGTHGNELSGLYLVREMLKPENRKEDGEPVSVLMVLSNPRAVQQCTRYVDTDLNRCFTHTTLNGPVSEAAPYEIIRARELNNLLGPKGSRAAVDLVCDLHNTTANMGMCFITYSDCDWVCLHIFRHLQKQMPDTPMRFIHFDVSTKESYSLDSIGKHGFAMEIGPQPHGCVKSHIYTAMKEGVQHMWDWVSCFNSGCVFEGGPVDVFTMVKNVDYPRDGETRNITAAIHPRLQDRDFCLLRPGEPLFQMFSGETMKYQGDEALYAFFINECAYYEKGIALSLARKRRVTVPSIRVQTDEEERASEQSFASEEEE